MANICADCTTRYATGLDNCPQCQSPDRYDEHDGPSVAETKPKSRRKPATDDGEPGEPTGM